MRGRRAIARVQRPQNMFHAASILQTCIFMLTNTRQTSICIPMFRAERRHRPCNPVPGAQSIHNWQQQI